MSQKVSRRTRRQTTDDDPTLFKSPTLKPNGIDASSPVAEEKETKEILEKEATTPPQPDEKSDEKDETPNGTEEKPIEKEEIGATTPESQHKTENESGMVTRSRSATPQVKKMANGHEDNIEEKSEDLNNTEESMEALIVADEPDPELQFEENSDIESGHGSPVLSRCNTRRSQNRNIPTPKTPKLLLEEDTPLVEAEEAEQDNEEEELNITFESCSENVSTKVEVGGDSTRLEVSNLETNSFLQNAKNKSFAETLRHLSTRRTIRPITYDYRKRVCKNNLEKDGTSSNYPNRNSIERVSSVGLKRKSSEETDGCRKRLKSNSSGFFAKFTSPLTGIKNPFKSDIPSSTPKLTGYKDDKFLIEDENSKMCEIRDGEKRWCLIM